MINLSGFLLWTFIQERNFVHGCTPMYTSRAVVGSTSLVQRWIRNPSRSILLITVLHTIS